MENESLQSQTASFDTIKQIDSDGQEWWSARDLYPLLEYKYWQDFFNVLQAAMAAYRATGGSVETHFQKTSKVTQRKSGRPYTLVDYRLTRHACYLTVLSADGSKPVIGLAKNYFAVTTRLYELSTTEEDRLRLERRELLREHNKALAAQAYLAGVVTSEQFSTFWNFGYLGLYRERAGQIRQRKGITSRQDIGDFSSSSELAQNIMKASLARDMMIARNVVDPSRANATHFEAGNLVRKMLIDAGVPTPELLPTPQKSYKQLLLEQVERERLAEEDRVGLWGQIQEGAIQVDEGELSPIEFGVKITLTPQEGDTEITIASVTAPLEEGTEYTTLRIAEPVPTSISIFWYPATPTGELLDEALFALSDYLTEMINQDQALKALYSGQSPLQL